VTLPFATRFAPAAIEQLKSGASAPREVIARTPGSDAAGLAYDAFEKAIATSRVLLIDTAGVYRTKQDSWRAAEDRARAQSSTRKPRTRSCSCSTPPQGKTRSPRSRRSRRRRVDGSHHDKLDGTAKGGILVALAIASPFPFISSGGRGISDLQPSMRKRSPKR